MIGSDGAGNPLCADEAGAVWMLDHEDSFRTREFVNSSVHLLAECLLAAQGENDPARMLAAVTNIDPPAAKNGCFWPQASQDLAIEPDEDEVD